MRHVGRCGLDLRFGHGLLGLGRLQHLVRGIDQRTRLVGLALGDELFFDQALFTLQVAPGFVQVDLRPRDLGPAGGSRGLGRQDSSPRSVHVGLGGTHTVFKGFRINLRDQLTSLDLGIKVDQQVADLARHLGAHRYLGDRVDGPAGRYRRLQTAAFNLRRAVLHGVGLGTLPPPPPAARQQNSDHQWRDQGSLLHTRILGKPHQTLVVTGYGPCKAGAKQPRRATSGLLAPSFEARPELYAKRSG